MSNRTRNYKIVHISEGFVLHMIHGMGRGLCLYVPRLVGVPDDVIVTDVHHCWDRKTFAFRLWHPSFPEVPIGEIMPTVEVTVDFVKLAKDDGSAAPAKPVSFREFI